MENNANVFSSNITRVGNNHKNNLYDLLNIVPATPLKLNDIKKYTCDYIPKTDKYYTSKRKSRQKVKTVRDIRKSFEQDTYAYLSTDLETQQNVLFKKIRRGSSRDDNTKTLAIKILRGDTPISKSTWQMLINLNPEQHIHPRQFVLWNGKYIQVNGSFGGRNKIICNYDLARKKVIPSQNNKKKCLKHGRGNKRKGLLLNSLAVKFKPGPLCKKKSLDDSHQKYHVGNIELTDLPKPGLDIQPTYGTALEPTITHFLNNLRKEDGTISRKWAELAVSVLGTVENSNAIQRKKACVSFDLAYKYNQNRLLMRRDVDHNFKTKLIDTDMITTNTRTVEFTVEPEIEDMINKIIDAVEINLIQDKIYTQEHELKPYLWEDLNSVDIVTHVKDKTKRKYGELDRLDVTVITLPETENRNLTRSCGKMHCSLGCICASIEGTYNLKQHCGRIECMFDCKCDFPKYKNDLSYTECSDLLPRLLSIDDELNLNLAKEEQKFHQTVIVTGEKRILLKGEKRNWKTSKKNYNNMSFKHENLEKRDLSIVALKLNCDNIEPWCMVHKLYKCFCKGKFTETCASISNETVVKEPLCKDTDSNVECLDGNSKVINDDSSIQDCPVASMKLQRTNSVKKSKISDNSHNKPNKLHTSRKLDKSTNDNNITENLKYDPEYEIQLKRNSVKDADNVPRSSSVSEIINMNVEKSMITRHSLRKLKLQQNSSEDKDKKLENASESDNSDYLDFLDYQTVSTSRTRAYEGRKYTNGYYKNTNSKILEMEKNDKRLQERLATLNSKTFQEKTVIKSTVKTKDATSLLEVLCDNNENSDDIIPKTKRKRLSNETKLVTWLESNYKMYKQRNDQGFFKNSLEPPQHGKVALHSWDFILKRYRERKNLFLVSRCKPFRIFMAVNTRNQFFSNCININDIRFADLQKYPQTVKNLLINATDLKDNFCILRGLSCCWELIGSVTKVNESDENGADHEGTPEINTESSDMETLAESNQNDSDLNSLIENTEQNNIQTQCITEKQFESNTTCPEDVGSSKWFVMTIENDFSEIRFFRKGFFVKHESIINAISVARLSGKTVRLSSKKCIEQPEIPQFGIYAIPNDNEYCVFVGPYEMEDTLGIETIKTILDVRRLRRTRGFWITTNKVDNLKVVENPLSFVPLSNADNNSAIPLETHFCAIDDINKKDEKSEMSESINSNKIEESKDCSSSKKEIKIVKPIKIRKTNGFYHLASDGILKKISLKYPQNTSKAMPVVLNTCLNIGDDATKSLLKSNAGSSAYNLNAIPESSQELIADATSQIKISSVFSTQNDDPIAKSAKHERGMFVLKPEEINRKLVINQLMSEMISVPSDEYNINNETTNVTLLDSDLENINNETSNFSLLESGLENVSITSIQWGGLNDDIYVISDDENDITSGTTENCNIWTDVCIECTNIPKLGWIAGIRNLDNLLSFKLPGCEYSEFYTEEEAYNKINIELLKRINNSSIDFELQWKVNESSDQLQGKEINPEHLYPDYILTQEGLLHTSDIIKSNKDNLKTYSKIRHLKGKGRGSASPCEIVKIDWLLETDQTSKNQDDQD